jgi:5'-nucleotidase (lipoprotein e(P4) family)
MKNRYPHLFLILNFLLLLVYSNISADNHEKYTTQDLNEQMVMASVWMQTSAEYRALCYQAFNIAKMNLDLYLTQKKSGKKPAIIVDADETVIDNSAFQAGLIGKNYGYSSKRWEKWMNASQATAIPGALEFLIYVRSKNVEVFYITNRKITGYDGTEKNLKALGFPYVDKKHLLLRTDTGDKQPRRDIVLKEYEVVLYMGDNLNDFKSQFGDKSVEQRLKITDSEKSNFGTKFIVLPNPTYGEWEGAIYDYEWGKTAEEKSKARKERLTTWD